MSLVKTTPPQQATGKLAELYGMAEQVFGSVPNNVRLLGVSPAILENQFGLLKHFMNHPTLKPTVLAAIRMLVSRQCSSAYCEALNSNVLMSMGVSPDQVDSMKANPLNAPFSDNEKALLSFVLKAVKEPHSVQAQDVDALKGMGWSEVSIFDAVAHGARMVGTNILFDAFKIDRE